MAASKIDVPEHSISRIKYVQFLDEKVLRSRVDPTATFFLFDFRLQINATLISSLTASFGGGGEENIVEKKTL